MAVGGRVTDSVDFGIAVISPDVAPIIPAVNKRQIVAADDVPFKKIQ